MIEVIYNGVFSLNCNCRIADLSQSPIDIHVQCEKPFVGGDVELQDKVNDFLHLQFPELRQLNIGSVSDIESEHKPNQKINSLTFQLY